MNTIKNVGWMTLCSAVLLVTATTAQDKFEGNWESLSKKPIPEWMKDAKFGIYTHWSVFSVPAKGGPDYITNLYSGPDKDEKGIYSHHVEKYGTLDQFGYKDFVPMFTAEKFNADEWVGLMAEAGAKFGGILLVHHDGFCLWDSEFTQWDSMEKGPKRDIYGEIATAVRKQDDMKLLATFHHARTFGYSTQYMKKSKTPMEVKKTWDIYDPAYNDFYWNEEAGASAQEFANEWENKIREVVDKYSPDCIWFDGLKMGKGVLTEQQVMDTFAYYFNEGEKKGQEVLICNKHAGDFNFPSEFGMRCFENGRQMPYDVEPWFLIDRAIAYPWSYVENKKYRDGPDYHTRSLIDLVARGGVFLLSLTPKGDGSIPDEEVAIMKGIGRWLKVNSEAIYATRPWTVYAEGPTKLDILNKNKKGKMLPGWNYRHDFTAEDIRFTRSKDGKTLYAIALNWPEDGKILIKNLKAGSEHYPNEIKSISMIGSDEKITWNRTPAGLEVTFPKEKPCEWAFSLKIQ